MPLVAFGYWTETLDKWAAEGYISKELAEGYRCHGDNSEADNLLMAQLGFDFNWNSCIGVSNWMNPPFARKVIPVEENGTQLTAACSTNNAARRFFLNSRLPERSK